MDLDPRIESFWFAGGMPLAFELKNVQYGVQDKAIQYIGQPLLTMRSEVPLVPVMPMSECESANFHVPCFEYSPHVAGIFVDRRRTVNTPGFWPGDPYQFGLVSYHRRGHLVDRIYSDPQDHQEALHRQGILASFSWLNAQANFLGFTTYNDITYPLITQSVITNGKFWSFYVYQFNTMLMHLKHIDENMKKNICWATKELKLFEDIKDEKVIGLNENVLKMLVSFYTNIPQDRTGIELRPFVSKEEKVIADYEDDDKRQWLEREYKFITSNRPRFLLPYEIYHWEKIYKIDHKTRPMDARRRPFELGIDPWKRTYDDRQPNYIPRKLRPDVKRHIGREELNLAPAVSCYESIEKMDVTIPLLLTINFLLVIIAVLLCSLIVIVNYDLTIAFLDMVEEELTDFIEYCKQVMPGWQGKYTKQRDDIFEDDEEVDNDEEMWDQCEDVSLNS